MNSKMLAKHFKEILEHEKRAKYFYNHFIDQIEDEEIKGVLVSIRNEERIHIQIAKALIDCIS